MNSPDRRTQSVLWMSVALALFACGIGLTAQQLGKARSAVQRGASASPAAELLPGFQNPPADVRLKARAGRIDAETPAKLEKLAESGFGAAELGIDFQSPQSGAWLAKALIAAKKNGVRIDLAPGGSQPYASPGISEADSMQQLTTVPSPILISDGALAYDSAPPALPADKLAPSPTLLLVAVTAAQVTDASGTPILLDPETAIDLTSVVDKAGRLHWTVPKGKWLVFGFWQRATGQIGNPNGPPFQNPAVWSARVPAEPPGRYFIADIFSGKGIAQALDYLKSNFLTPENLRLLKGGQFAHDSIELETEMFWTTDLPAQFESRRGYSVIKYLPALYRPKESSFDPLTPGWGAAPLTPKYDFIHGVGNRVRYDYARTLTDLYVDRYLKTFTDKLNAMGMSSRVQVAYNYLQLNMTRSGAAVDIPENEALDSGWMIESGANFPVYGSDRWRLAMDSYRLTGSGAHLNKGKRATFEFGDDLAMYKKQPIDYAQQLNEAQAGGITMGLLTAFMAIDDSWPAPGFGFALGIGDAWTTGWPQWRDWRDLADYFARSTLVLETGKPQIDAVIYLDKGLASVHESNVPKFPSSALESAGYTYDFVDPVSLTTKRATAVEGRLFGSGPSYRALIINNQSAIPADAAQTILAAARSGLKVVVVGSPPSKNPGLNHADQLDALVVQAMARLLKLGNVARVDTADEVAGALLRLGCRPSASFGSVSPLLTVHRKTDQNEDIWWVFNPTAKDVSATGRFVTSGVPYRLDLWNGTAGRVAQWQAGNGVVSVPVVLPAHATTALLFRHEAAPVHVTTTSAEEALSEDGHLLIRDTRGVKQTVVLSNGRALTVDLGAVAAPIEVDAWHLDVDEISPNGHTAHNIDLAALRDWRSIPGLESAVGSATYTATVDIPESWLDSHRDVLLDLGDVAGAMHPYVNGNRVTNQTTPGGEWSVRNFLKPGKNQIVITLDTTLLNRMAQLSNSHASGYYSMTPLLSAPSGLIGPVKLISAAVRTIGQE